jgi:outer membrane protein assembly factor BamE (lipoprotein component of BamABCDE complex)
MKKIAQFFCLCLLLTLITACAPTVISRGNMVSDAKFSKITPLVSTKYDVNALWGPPTTVAPFDPNTWYYIGETTHELGILKKETVKRRVIEIKFSADDKVSSITPFNPDDEADVAMIQKRTPTAGAEPTVIRQFIGNIGKFNTPRPNSLP